MQELAAEMGSTRPPVSRALSGQPGVSDEVRRAYLRTALQRGSLRTAGTHPGHVAHRDARPGVRDATSEFMTNTVLFQGPPGIAPETTRTSQPGVLLAFPR